MRYQFPIHLYETKEALYNCLTSINYCGYNIEFPFTHINKVVKLCLWYIHHLQRSHLMMPLGYFDPANMTVHASSGNLSDNTNLNELSKAYPEFASWFRWDENAVLMTSNKSDTVVKRFRDSPMISWMLTARDA